MLKIAHIVNVVNANPWSELHNAQKITLASLRRAKQEAQNGIEVSQYTAQFPEDRQAIPDDFTATPSLTRSILELGDFKTRRRLPLLRDILLKLHQTSDADLFIYTNIDIAVKPSFYNDIAEIADRGIDAFVIRRRDISGAYDSIDELPAMYSEKGIDHIGHDCFVFDRSLFTKFVLNNACLGIFFVGASLFINMLAFAKNFHTFNDLNLTFHIGFSNPPNTLEQNELTLHNADEFMKTWHELKNQGLRIDHLWLSRIVLPEVKSLKKRMSKRSRLFSTHQNRLLKLPKSIFHRFWQYEKRVLGLDEFRKDDTFVVSYPRSGNTWTRFIIANLLHPGKVVSFRNIEYIVPNLYVSSHVANRLPGPRILKTHFPFFNKFSRVIYPIRDGRDAILSFYRYDIQNGNYEGTFTAYLRSRMPLWAQHIDAMERFRKCHPERILIIPFESIKNSPRIVAGQIADFLGIPVIEQQLTEAAENCSLSRLRANENNYGPELLAKPNVRFFGQGQSGLWKEKLSQDDVEYCNVCAGKQLKSLEILNSKAASAYESVMQY